MAADESLGGFAVLAPAEHPEAGWGLDDYLFIVFPPI